MNTASGASADGLNWQRADARQFGDAVDGQKQLCAMRDPTSLRAFAQRPLGLEDFQQRESSLRARLPDHEQVIGHSMQERQFHKLAFGNPWWKRVLLVIGRHHPPETTPSEALRRFVDQLSSDTPVARRFRQDMLVVLVTMLNPDGVVEGHWCGSADGKDLNRDWGAFTEPETRAVPDALRYELDDGGRSLPFAVDFHSTWQDIFYTVSEDLSRAPGGALRRWMDSMYARYPGRIHERANAAKGTVFKNWVFKRYHAPAVTYEVGDRTEPRKLRERAHFAADSLMQLLWPPARWI